MHPQCYRTIIWDWNGTLFDDAWLCIDIMNGMLAERGLPPLTAEKYARIFDFPVRNYYARLGFDPRTDPFERLSDRFITEYLQRNVGCVLREAALPTIRRLHRAGKQQLILSAAEHDHLLRILNQFELADYFTDIRGLDNHHADGKLHNAAALMQSWSLVPQETLLVGDTLHDWEVACSIGVACVLIPSGHQSRERLTAAGATVIDRLSQIAGLVLPR